MNESSSAPPDGGNNNEKQQKAAAPGAAATAIAAPAALAWYARPWLWSMLLFILLALYGGWLLWLQWQAHASMKLAQEDLVLAQQARNAQLEADAARLREALDTDPCVARGILQDWRVPAPLSVPEQKTPSTPGPKVPTAPDQKTPSAPGPKAAPATGNTLPEAPPPPTKPTSANEQTIPEPKGMAQLLEQATVLILTQSPQGVMMGTGFFIAPGIVLTNQHVVATGKYPMVVVGKFKGTVADAKMLAISTTKGRDYAVLKVPVTNVKPLPINLSVIRTQKISAWGFPGAVTGDDPKFQALMKGEGASPPEVVYSEGSVSVVLDRTPPLIVHTAVVSQGNSGGPLVNDKGHVVGINTYIRLDEESYRQSSIAIVGKDLVAFLKEHNIPFTLATDKE